MYEQEEKHVAVNTLERIIVWPFANMLVTYYVLLLHFRANSYHYFTATRLDIKLAHLFFEKHT